MCGWIKLQRDIMSHWIAQDNEYLAVWIRMLAEANYEPQTKMFNGQVITVGRGQFIFGLDSYAEKTKVSVMRLRRLVDLLEKHQMINRVKSAKYSLISIVNYDKYQADNKQTASTEQADNNTIRSKEINKKRRSAKSVDFEPSAKLTFSQKCFEVFWDEVEKKGTDKAGALKAFEKYTTGKSDDEIEYILNVICHWYELYLQEDESRLLSENKKYLKSAAAWLNSAPWRVDQKAYAEFKKKYYEEVNESGNTNQPAC